MLAPPEHRTAPVRTLPGYGALTRTLHWLMAILIVASAIMGLAIGRLDGPTGQTLLAWHAWIGLALIAMLPLRLAARLGETSVFPRRTVGAFERLGARATHVALYVLILAAPLGGIAQIWARGEALSVFGLFDVAAPFAPDRMLALQVGLLHTVLSYALIGLSALHTLAALWHHYVRRG